ncbi:hypothetical protein V7147_10730 [Bacillus sp. JJ1521]|uniref:hypothetical protein n=1 Tax=Bacillus sp. JJ1521 TaxID=3122957 RepID=UPI002FFEBC4C
MENETMLKEILNAFNLFSKKMDEKFEKMDDKFEKLEKKMDEGFANINKKLDRLTVRLDGVQEDLNETKETVQFLHTKVVQHDKKLHKLSHQQQ